MIWQLARRNVADRPWRSALLLAGYAVGVAVMIVLLSVGEALLVQARDERLVGGGEITVLPEGLDVEVMKTGGLGGMFFSIDHAWFIHHQLLASPRLADAVRIVAPQIDGKLVYLRANGAEYPVRARGEIPSASAALGAGRPVLEGAWRDDEGDRRWIAPAPADVAHRIDRFHLPPATLESRDSWAEWHYANVLLDGGRRWMFITWMVGGDIAGGGGGGQMLVTVRGTGGEERRFTTVVEPRRVRIDSTRADVVLGESFVRVDGSGAYIMRALAGGEGGSVRIHMRLEPEPRAWFPGADIGGSSEGDSAFLSGYAVAALRARATGTVCVDGACDAFADAPAYKDHNWGTWRGVTWEWGEARAGSLGLLYGRVIPPDAAGGSSPLFVYLVDSLGFRALFRPREIEYVDASQIVVDGRRIRVPSRARMRDVRGDDTLTIEIEVEDATGTDIRGGVGASRGRMARPYFIQMKGTARVQGRAMGSEFRGEGPGFFETFR